LINVYLRSPKGSDFDKGFQDTSLLLLPPLLPLLLPLPPLLLLLLLLLLLSSLHKLFARGHFAEFKQINGMLTAFYAYVENITRGSIPTTARDGK